YFMGNVAGKTLREAFAGVDETFVSGVEMLYRLTSWMRCPYHITGPSSRYANIFFPAYDSLYLPYSSDGERADRIVTALWYNRLEIAARAATLTGSVLSPSSKLA